MQYKFCLFFMILISAKENSKIRFLKNKFKYILFIIANTQFSNELFYSLFNFAML